MKSFQERVATLQTASYWKNTGVSLIALVAHSIMWGTLFVVVAIARLLKGNVKEEQMQEKIQLAWDATINAIRYAGQFFGISLLLSGFGLSSAAALTEEAGFLTGLGGFLSMAFGLVIVAIFRWAIKKRDLFPEGEQIV